MNYYLDTEFLEGAQKSDTSKLAAIGILIIAATIFIFSFFINPLYTIPFAIFLAVLTGLFISSIKAEQKTNPTIDLISIGIVSEDNREYYAVSKDFNLKEAWNRFQWKTTSKSSRRSQGKFSNKEHQIKEYWIRENVLKPIYYEWCGKDINFHEIDHFTYSNFKKLLNKYGKTNKQIAKEIRNFVMSENINEGGQIVLGDFFPNKRPNPEFYAYYADYDWVAFCWLFGKMIDLPKGFPKYCRDLKQMLDEKIHNLNMYYRRDIWANDPKRFMKGDLQKDDRPATFDEKLKTIKTKHPDLPKETNEHHALADAKWNKKLHEFIKTI